MLSPVIIFTYNRPDHLSDCIESLRKNLLFYKTNFYIIQDKLKEPNKEISIKYKSLFNNLEKNFVIIKRKKNYGLRKNIINGISYILKKYHNVIVCEDDLVFHKDFLNFMNTMLKNYSLSKKISSISGFSYVLKKQLDLFPSEFLLKLTSSWGWATTRIHWMEFLNFDSRFHKQDLFKNKNIQYFFDYDNSQTHTLWLKINTLNKISSWNIEWEFFNFIKKYYTLYPKNTYVENRGFDGSGIHCNKSNYKFQRIDHNFRFKNKTNKVTSFEEKTLFRNIIKKNITDGFLKKILKRIIYFNYIK